MVQTGVMPAHQYAGWYPAPVDGAVYGMQSYPVCEQGWGQPEVAIERWVGEGRMEDDAAQLQEAMRRDPYEVAQLLAPRLPGVCLDAQYREILEKLLEVPDVSTMLLERLRGSFLNISVNATGCRIVQKLLAGLDARGHQAVAAELRTHVVGLVRNSNGNYVISCFLEKAACDDSAFIVEEVGRCPAEMIRHQYGCRVVQRIMEHFPMDRLGPFRAEVLANLGELVKDKFGNFVVQHMLEKGEPADAEQVVAYLLSNIASVAQEKFASMVAEKALEVGSTAVCHRMIDACIADSPQGPAVHNMATGRYGNYVVQRMLQQCPDRDDFVARLQQIPRLKGFGKHIKATLNKRKQTGGGAPAGHAA